ncbi:hypothetical protein LPB03_15030 [Polaribacter vadi]|uniref:TonB-dependent receptor plug domain-containing protein n=1 Tax=Polaribacter vadi TaxID=1774273 RepID=A0A1B8TQM2_9FLAO|nr:TonB-dependent receptor plug domain-containing protein [Polaribacter vadi]AOW18688.1 hypothetical protein LPB03_15030 [Polaribacter vadi]OBY61950.1 hypothetical protein LPB3_14280 [Polaribacter vadi]
MKTTKYIFLLLILIFTLNISSQESKNMEEIKLTILVHDVNNNPIPGAIILIDDVKQQRLTNSAGYFKIKLDKAPKEITAFSPSIGVMKVTYNNNDKIIIKIISENKSADLVTEDSNSSNNTIQFKDIYDYLRGKVPGVHVNGNNIISIRGYNTVNGSNIPMFILNDNQVSQSIFGNIVPTTIKSVQIYKGTETSIFGSRGANGVIKVTTF